MKQLAEIRADFNPMATEILFADAELALTLIDVARGRDRPEAREQALAHARRAYEEIKKLGWSYAGLELR